MVFSKINTFHRSSCLLLCLLAAHLTSWGQSQANRCVDAEYAVQQMLITYQPGQVPDISKLNRWYQLCPNPGYELQANYYLLQSAWYAYDRRFSAQTAIVSGSENLDAAFYYQEQTPGTRGQNPEAIAAFNKISLQVRQVISSLAGKPSGYSSTSYREYDTPQEENWVKGNNGLPNTAAAPANQSYRGPVEFEKRDLFAQSAPVPAPTYEYTTDGLGEPYGFVGSMDSLSLMQFFQWINRPRPDEEVVAYQPQARSRGMSTTPDDIPTWEVTTIGIGLADTTIVFADANSYSTVLGFFPWGAKVALLGERRFVPSDQTFFEKIRLENGRVGWIQAGSVAEEDRIGVLIREMPLFEVGPDQQTRMVLMLAAGSLVAVSDRQGEWIRVDEPAAKASGWIADPSVLSLSSIDREIALRMHQAVLESNQLLQTSQLLQISKLPGFYESALAPVILAQIERNSRS